MSEFAANLYRNARTADDRRLASRVWLTDAIRAGMQRGEDVAPALDLLSALEGIDFGSVDEMFRLPEGQKAGGKEAPPAESGLDAMALAAIDRLKELGVKDAIATVADELDLSTGALVSKRKHVMAERAKSLDNRQRYVALIDDYENERARMAEQTEQEVILGLSSVAKLLGRK